MRLRRFFCALAMCGCALAQTAEWSPVEKALGRSGKEMPGGVFRFGMPRSDLDVKFNGTKLAAPFALGSWVAFQGDANTAMLMGDLVLTEREIQPVIAKLTESGIQVTAIHNHVIGEVPHVMYVHIGAHGNPLELAKSLHDALALTGTPTSGAGPSNEAKLNFDRASIEQAMGKAGTLAGEVLQFSFSRSERIEEGGMKVSPAMGIGIAINFEAAGKGEVATTGDFVLLANEVHPVIKALKANGIDVTALHNHMLEETPRLFFLHFWGVGAPAKVAAAMRSGVDATSAVKK